MAVALVTANSEKSVTLSNVLFQTLREYYDLPDNFFQALAQLTPQQWREIEGAIETLMLQRTPQYEPDYELTEVELNKLPHVIMVGNPLTGFAIYGCYNHRRDAESIVDEEDADTWTLPVYPKSMCP